MGELVIEVPNKMRAQVVRESTYGEPKDAFNIEEVDVPTPQKGEVLVKVVCAGLNYNNVWASRGYPVNLIQTIGQEPYHVTGSDASGIVSAVGKGVSGVEIGDEIVIAPIWHDHDDPEVLDGGDPVLANSIRAWGFETNWGSLGEYALVKDFQCIKKPQNLSWEESATIMLSAGTAYRMLTHHQPHNIKEGDVVLIWGGSGGLGVMATQLCLHYKAIPVCVVSSEEKKAFCESLGAKVVLRTSTDHWGPLEEAETTPEKQVAWRNEAKVILKDVLKLTGGKRPQIVLEHPGQDTFPTSLFVCDKGGMVVTCAGTTGYLATFDLRYLWLAKKRIQGSHGASTEEFQAVADMFEQGILVPKLSDVYEFDQVPEAVQTIHDNVHKPGSIAVRIGNK